MKYRVEGKNRICGEITVQGSRNAAIPILAASLLTKRSTLYNCPNISDIDNIIEILNYLGCNVIRTNESVHIVPDTLNNYVIKEKFVRQQLSSILLIGAMLGRCGMVKFFYPGGDSIGKRPIDNHLNGLKELGVEIYVEEELISCYVKERLKGTTINLEFPSVGATQNIILAACTAEGVTIINNTAKEPEIDDLIDFLNNAGAQIRRDGDSVIIVGVESLGQAEHKIITDRIAAITYLSAAAITGGEITIKNVCIEHIKVIIDAFIKMGCTININKDSIYLAVKSKLLSIGTIKAEPYPGFPTDAQSFILSLCCVAIGSTYVIEEIFESRFQNVEYLIRMGAQIEFNPKVNSALIKGPSELHGNDVACSDLRGGAALVIAALAADGITIINNIDFIKRGYQDFCKNLNMLGAKIIELE